MDIPPSFSLYLMAKKKQKQQQQSNYTIKASAQPIEEINVFHIPVSQSPYQIPGTKIGILTEEDLQPAQNNDHKQILLDEVQTQLNLLKSVLRDNTKQDHVQISHDLEIQEAAQVLSHTQQLELMNELVSVRKELNNLQKDQNLIQKKEQEAINEQLQQSSQKQQYRQQQEQQQIKQIENEQRRQVKQKRIDDENARQQYLRQKDRQNQLHKSNNSYHSDHDEYPNHYIHKQSPRQQITEQILIMSNQQQQPQVKSIELEQPYSKSIDDLYNSNYVNSRSLEGRQKITCPEKKRTDHVEKLPHTDREKRQIIKDIVEDVLYQEMQTTPQMMYQQPKRKQTYDDVRQNQQENKQEQLQQLENQLQTMDSYDELYNEAPDYSKYNYDEPEQRQENPRRQKPQQQLAFYEEDYKQKIQQQQKRQKNPIYTHKVYLPQIDNSVQRRLIQDRKDMQESNSSHLRFKKDIRKSIVGQNIADDIFNELFENQLALYIQTALEAAESEMKQ